MPAISAKPSRPAPVVFVLFSLLVGAIAAGGCGKKGDPLPPLVRLPAAPAEFVAERRADEVNLRFLVPAANSDGSRPADIERVDIYAITGPPTITETELIRSGMRIASLQVKSPRDPSDTIGPDDSDADLEPLVGAGLDQGASAHAVDNLTYVLRAPNAAGAVRSYVVVGVSTRGRRGLLSRRIAVPLGAAAQPPSAPQVTYDATTISVSWAPSPSSGAASTYHVYDATPAPDRKEALRLTPSPVAEPRFSDNRIEWGAERCYAVSVVETQDDMSVESTSSAPTCVRLADTFPPAAPQGVVAVQSEGAVNLSWDPSDAADLAGYLVLRAESPGDQLLPLTPSPIVETTFRDTPRPGVRYTYAIQALDRNGNASAPSARVDAAAR
ncbi:MAG TPA: hypothetical protein VJP86_16785 [Vicinamibacterales bacterium]|nr:hypothetical protein [Vicinamibacterales bacterium]